MNHLSPNVWNWFLFPQINYNCLHVLGNKKYWHLQGWKINFYCTHHLRSAFNQCNKKAVSSLEKCSSLITIVSTQTRWRLSLTVTSAWKKPSGMWSSSKLKSRSTGSLGLEFCLSRFAACANNFGFERPGHGPSSFSRRTYKNEERKNFNKGIYTWHCSNCIC